MSWSGDRTSKKASVLIVSIEASRGDKTAFDPFLAGVRGWEAYPLRPLDDGKPVEHMD